MLDRSGDLTCDLVTSPAGGSGGLAVRSARLSLCRGDQRVADAAAALASPAPAARSHRGALLHRTAPLGEAVGSARLKGHCDPSGETLWVVLESEAVTNVAGR